MSNGLSVSRLVNIQINLSPAAAQARNLEALLLLGTSTVIDTVTRMRSYTTLAQVATDFGSVAEEYLAAKAWFAQTPQPKALLIGRWAKTASAGQLIGGPVSAANQLMSAWTGIANGSIRFVIDGGAATNVSNLNFAAAANLNAVAAIITAALGAAATVVWNPTYQRFEVTSATTGAASSIAFADTTGAGTDISSMMALRAASSGAYVAPGIIAETALAAVTLFDQRFSNQWYGLVIPSGTNSDCLAVAGYVEAANPSHYFGVTTMDPNAAVASATTDIAYLLANGLYKKTACIYSASSPYAVMSLLGRILTTNYASAKSVINMMFKQLPGIPAELLTTTQADALRAKNCNVLAVYNNETAIVQYGTCASGHYIDEVIGIDWLQSQLQTNAYNLLLSTPKVAQTDEGMHQIATVLEAACIMAVNNGLLAPGVWNAAGFGQLAQGDNLPKGYYIFTPPISSQSANDRAARKSVPFQIAAKGAGGVDTVFSTLNFNS